MPHPRKTPFHPSSSVQITIVYYTEIVKKTFPPTPAYPPVGTDVRFGEKRKKNARNCQTSTPNIVRAAMPNKKLITATASEIPAIVPNRLQSGVPLAVAI